MVAADQKVIGVGRVGITVDRVWALAKNKPGTSVAPLELLAMTINAEIAPATACPSSSARPA